jgi:DNA-binding NtrC family response regulator
MVAVKDERKEPLSLVVTGEAESWLPALQRLVGPEVLISHRAQSREELLNIIEAGAADMAVLDDDAPLDLSVLQLLRMIRRLDRMLQVVVVTRHHDRRWLEDALRLTAFSVVRKPLELEALLRQIARMMERIDRMLRDER